MKSLYLFLLACCFSLVSSAQIVYQPSGTASFTGAGSYCVDSVVAPLVYTYTTCNSGSSGLPSGLSCEIRWYYNTTNSTSTVGATLASGPIPFTTSTAATGSLSYTPSIAVGGNYYFFCVISWTSGGSATCSGVSGSITSATTQLITKTPGPIVSTTTPNVCVGSSIGLTNAFPGGTWSSSNSSIISVGSTSGVATGVSVGAATITYQLSTGCKVVSFVNAHPLPATISPIGSPIICVGSTRLFSSDTVTGIWSSSTPSVASVGSSSGVVSAFVSGTATISYTHSATGCVTTRVVNIADNPLPITGATGVCIGSTTTLSSATPSGVWVSASTPIATVNSATGLVSGLSGGTTRITYIIASTGCFATTIATVSTTPASITGTAVVCAGSSTTLFNSVPGGSWSTAAPATAVVGSTGIVTGVSAGLVNISYTTPGCPSVLRTVTVNSLPGTIFGVPTTCYGQTTTLTNPILGGTWSSTNTGVATVGSSSGIVTGVSLGTASIVYTVASGCAVGMVVTVHPLANIEGSDSVCVGSDILLTNIVGGGTWVSSNPAVAQIDTFTGLVTGLVDGISYVGYTTAEGCATTFFLRVIPALPAIAGPSLICSNTEVILSNGVSGGRWSTSNQYVADVDSLTGKVSGHYPDTAVITYMIYGCIANTTVTINPLPSPTLTYNWIPRTLTTTPIYLAYQWYDTSGAIPGATSNVFTMPYTNASYYVVVTDFFGCDGPSDVFEYTVGVKNLDKNELYTIYPNPATDVVYFDGPEDTKIVISSIDGRVVSSVVNAKQISTRDFNEGIYFVRFYNTNGVLVETQKLLK